MTQSMRNINRKQQGLAWLQFCMCIIKKIKHQVYGLLEGDREQQSQIASFKDKEQHGLSTTRIIDNEYKSYGTSSSSSSNNIQHVVDDMNDDGLFILQSGIFEKYQSMIRDLIHQQQQSLTQLLLRQQKQSLISSSRAFKFNHFQAQSLEYDGPIANHISNNEQQQQQCQLQLQSKIKSMENGLQQEQYSKESNHTRMQTNNQLVLNLLHQLKTAHHHSSEKFNHHNKSANSSKQPTSPSTVGYSNIQQQQQLSQLIKAIQQQPQLLLLQITNNTLIIKLKPSQQQHEKQLQQQQQQQQQYQPQQYQQPQLQSTNRYLSAQRQLEFLIKEKQLNKKLSQTLQQIEQLKNLLQQKQYLITQKDTQINQLKKDKLHIMKNRKHNNVTLLKHKVETDSIIRELCLERERDSMEMFIEKENINNVNNKNTILNINTKPKQYSYMMISSTNSTSKIPSKLSLIKSPISQTSCYQDELKQ